MRTKNALKAALVSTMIATMSITSIVQPLRDNTACVMAAKKTIKKVDKKGILYDYNGKGELYLSDKVSAVSIHALDSARVTSFRVSSSNPYLKSVDGVLYTKSGNRLVRYPNAARTERFVVPEGVTSLCYGAFRDSDVKNVVLPESLIRIGTEAFCGCDRLESINIPSKIDKISGRSFQFCKKLKQITLPKKVEIVGSQAFSNCTELKEVTFLSGKAKVRSSAFYDCKKLEKVNVKNGLNEIGNNAFYGCGSLQSIKFGKKLLRIDRSAFSGCSALKSVHIPGNVDYIGTSAFSKCTRLQVVSIADGVEEIASGAFSNCTNLTNVKLPDTISKISSEMFEDCISLNKITIPANVTKIGDSAFDGCKSLTEISIPNYVSKVESYAFRGCLSLRKVKLSTKLQTIYRSTFYGCASLEDITFPDSVNGIMENAFGACDKLSTIKITKNIVHIDSSAFDNTGERYVVDANNSDYTAIDGVLYSNDKKTLIKYPAYKAGNYKTPESVRKVNKYAFTNCKKLKVVELGEKVTNIDAGLCVDTSIEKLILPKTLSYVEYGYKYCESSNNLKAVEIPEGNENYFTKDGVLYDTNGKLYIYPMKREGTITFPYNFNNSEDIPLDNCASKFVVVASADAIYKNDDCVITNKKMTRVEAFPGKMQVYHMGAKMQNATRIYYNKEFLKCFKNYDVNDDNDKYCVKNGMLYIGNELVDCPNGKKGKVVLGTNTKSIKNSAFTYTTGISEIVFKENIKSVSFSLKGSNVKKVRIAEGNMRSISIDYGKKLKELDCPNSLIRVDLYGYNSKDPVTIKAWSNTKIEEYAKCMKLKFVSKGYVPSKVRNVKVNGFANARYAVLKWSVDPDVSGYEVTINNKVKLIKNNQVNQMNVFVGSRYRTEMEIRSYKIQKGKKIFGKARTVVYKNDY
ncbi:MAG: leucine-rich repeat protein [Lachnospiraceae bacterium]|nr:leucine-rich repeat protein [Lachnospiraceae bacterium]